VTYNISLHAFISALALKCDKNGFTIQATLYEIQGLISMRLVRLKSQGPGPDRVPNRPVQRKFSTTLGPNISTEKIAVSVNSISEKRG